MKAAPLFLATAMLIGGAAMSGAAEARDRSERMQRSENTEITANQITDQISARTARIKAELRLTPEQDKNWAGFESAMIDIGKLNADRRVAMRAERAERKNDADVIDKMLTDAKMMGERSAENRKLAEAARPLYASLDDKQKRRFGEELWGLSHTADSE